MGRAAGRGGVRGRGRAAERPGALGHGEVPLGRLFPRSTDPARIVVYRRPVETRARTCARRARLVHDVVVEQVAQLLGGRAGRGGPRLRPGLRPAARRARSTGRAAHPRCPAPSTGRHDARHRDRVPPGQDRAVVTSGPRVRPRSTCRTASTGPEPGCGTTARPTGRPLTVGQVDHDLAPAVSRTSVAGSARRRAGQRAQLAAAPAGAVSSRVLGHRLTRPQVRDHPGGCGVSGRPPRRRRSPRGRRLPGDPGRTPAVTGTSIRAPR